MPSYTSVQYSDPLTAQIKLQFDPAVRIVLVVAKATHDSRSFHARPQFHHDRRQDCLLGQVTRRQN